MPGPGPHAVLDNACGIGTRALGLSAPGHEVAGTDLSPRSAARATREAAARGLAPPVAAADMRTPPFVDASFDAVVCADNALPHLLTAQDVRAALAETRRVLRPGRATRPCGDLLGTGRGARPRTSTRAPTGGGPPPSSCGTGTPTGGVTTWSSSNCCRPATPGRPAPRAPRTGRAEADRAVRPGGRPVRHRLARAGGHRLPPAAPHRRTPRSDWTG
nr:methyltransferase domain-containing protein [Streptomyces sp. gCLA4]